MRRLAHRWTVLLAALAGLLVALPATATAGRYGYMHNGFGVTSEGSPAPVTFLGATPDTATVAFSTADPLSFIDHDGKEDLYANDSFSLLTPLASPVNATDPEFDAASVKVLPGGGVLFTSRNQIGGSQDTATDLFLEPSYGAPLVDLSDPPNVSNDTNIPSNVVVSADGSSIAFTTQADLLPGDTQPNAPDVYRYRDGTLTLVTTGTAQGTSTGISADGSRVFWESGVAQQPCPSDGDGGAYDVYSSAAPFLTVDSPTCGYVSGGEGAPGAVGGVSPSGTTVALHTRESFTGADSVAASPDVYAFTGVAGAKRLTAVNGSEPSGQPAVVRACDGGNVLFTTSKALTGADQDSAVDLYRSDGTTTTLMSPGATADVAVVATSTDCADAAWVAAGDLSIAHDGGTARLISSGVRAPAAGTAPRTLHATLAFTTTQQLAPGDADGGADDVYQYDRASGSTWWVSTFAKTDGRAQDLAAESDDGSRVVVSSAIALPSGTDPSDDGAVDLFRYTMDDDSMPPAECSCGLPPDRNPNPNPVPLPAPRPAAPAAAPARPKLTFTTKGLAVRRSGRRTTAIVTRIRVACPAGSAVSCTVTFAAKAGRKAYASSKATIKSGKSATLSIKLSSKALKQLRKAKRLKLTFTITAHRAGGADVRRSFSATLRAPKG